MERCDWSVGRRLETSNEASTMLFTYDFRKFISSVKGTQEEQQQEEERNED